MKFAHSIFLFSLLLFFSLSACRQDPQGGGNADGTDTTEKQVELDVDDENIQPTIPTGITPDPDRFPYLEVINDSTTKMHAYTVKMNLTHSYPFAPVTNDRLMWIDETGSNETMGTFLSYVIQGRKIMLSAVNLRIDYFNKTVPGYSSIDSSFYSAQSYFLAVPDSSQLLKERQEIPTKSGRMAQVEEYYSYRGEGLTPKYVANGYIDYNDTYIVSFIMTAVEEYEFKDALPGYYELVKSFELE